MILLVVAVLIIVALARMGWRVVNQYGERELLRQITHRVTQIQDIRLPPPPPHRHY